MFIQKAKAKLSGNRGSIVVELMIGLLVVAVVGLIVGLYIRITEISASVRDAMTQAVLRLEGQNDFETHNRRESTTMYSSTPSLEYIHRELERTLGIDKNGEKEGQYRIYNLRISEKAGNLIAGDDRLYMHLTADIDVYVNIFTKFTMPIVALGFGGI